MNPIPSFTNVDFSEPRIRFAGIEPDSHLPCEVDEHQRVRERVAGLAELSPEQADYWPPRREEVATPALMRREIPLWAQQALVWGMVVALLGVVVLAMVR